MRAQTVVRSVLIALVCWSAAWLAGCGAGVFNSAFLNTLIGGQTPVTPGPGAAFVFVRCVNDTNEVVRFFLTIQRSVLEVDSNGNFVLDDMGMFVTNPEREQFDLLTRPAGRSREAGMLFPCGESPVTHVGLGENLLKDDIAVEVGGTGTGGTAGSGVPAGNLNPLQLEAGNFNCGDTIIFRAFRATGIAGGVALQSFLLPGSEQPSNFAGPNTFVNLENFLESQVREDR